MDSVQCSAVQGAGASIENVLEQKDVLDSSSQPTARDCKIALPKVFATNVGILSSQVLTYYQISSGGHVLMLPGVHCHIFLFEHGRPHPCRAVSTPRTCSKPTGPY